MYLLILSEYLYTIINFNHVIVHHIVDFYLRLSDTCTFKTFYSNQVCFHDTLYFPGPSTSGEGTKLPYKDDPKEMPDPHVHSCGPLQNHVLCQCCLQPMPDLRTLYNANPDQYRPQQCKILQYYHIYSPPYPLNHSCGPLQNHVLCQCCLQPMPDLRTLYNANPDQYRPHNVRLYSTTIIYSSPPPPPPHPTPRSFLMTAPEPCVMPMLSTADV